MWHPPKSPILSNIVQQEKGDSAKLFGDGKSSESKEMRASRAFVSRTCYIGEAKVQNSRLSFIIGKTARDPYD